MNNENAYIIIKLEKGCVIQGGKAMSKRGSLLVVIVCIMSAGILGLVSTPVEAAGGVLWPGGIFAPPFQNGTSSNSGVYYNHCPVGTTGGYVGNGNYYCH